MLKYLFCLVFTIVCSLSVLSQSRQRFRMVELNVENLFDCVHDKYKADRDYLPDGKRHWTQRRLRNKLLNIGKELMALSDRRAPDLIALEEVENSNVMKMLAESAHLRKEGYRYLMTNGKDIRGIDVALMYLPKKFRPVHCRSLRMNMVSSKGKAPRDVLYVAGRLQNGDTLHVFVCHLSSKMNGKDGVRMRNNVCRMIRNKCNHLFKQNPMAHIVITGDFNDNPSSSTLTDALMAEPVSAFADKGDFYGRLCNLSSEFKGEGDLQGTYKYKRKWDIFDQCIVSASMLSDVSKVRTSPENLSLGALDFVLTEDTRDGTRKPWRTYEGYRYQDGYSDHLPIYVDFLISH